ncbi:MAG TPA: hypothetical protein VMC06_15440, partial [Opitutaceae bacterium]|nr:hypothetical protein [Opitutaceae bacterium]
LNRGAFGGVQLLPPAAIERLERATSTYGARAGLTTGYGLGNYTTVLDGLVYHGHDGSRPGCLTEMDYLPDAGIGFVFMINTKNAATFFEVRRLLCAYVERSIVAPSKPPATIVPAATAREFDGWYEPISSRFEFFHCWERLLSLSKVTRRETGLEWKPLLQHRDTYVAVTDHLFRRKADPIPTLALIADHAEGTLLQLSELPGIGATAGQTFRRIPGWLVAVEILLSIVTPLLMLSSQLFAMVWVPRKLAGRMRGIGHLSVRALPLLATLPVACLVAWAWTRGDVVNDLVAWLAPSSPKFFWLFTTVGGLAATGVVQALRLRHTGINRGVWWHSFATSTAIAIVSLYFGYWGVIGLRTWV